MEWVYYFKMNHAVNILNSLSIPNTANIERYNSQ